jgi:hypothetical protein
MQYPNVALQNSGPNTLRPSARAGAEMKSKVNKKVLKNCIYTFIFLNNNFICKLTLYWSFFNKEAIFFEPPCSFGGSYCIQATFWPSLDRGCLTGRCGLLICPEYRVAAFASPWWGGLWCIASSPLCCLAPGGLSIPDAFVLRTSLTCLGFCPSLFVRVNSPWGPIRRMPAWAKGIFRARLFGLDV